MTSLKSTGEGTSTILFNSVLPVDSTLSLVTNTLMNFQDKKEKKPTAIGTKMKIMLQMKGTNN
jgi:hypothetical protein